MFGSIFKAFANGAIAVADATAGVVGAVASAGIDVGKAALPAIADAVVRPNTRNRELRNDANSSVSNDGRGGADNY